MVVACLTDLAAKTAAPRQDDDSAGIKFDVYLRELMAYPPDVVRDVLRECGKQCTFFPTWSELYARLEVASAWRQSAAAAVQAAIQRQGVLA